MWSLTLFDVFRPEQLNKADMPLAAAFCAKSHIMSKRIIFSLLWISTTVVGRFADICYRQQFIFNVAMYKVIIKSFWPQWILGVLPILFLFNLVAYPFFKLIFSWLPSKRCVMVQDTQDSNVWPPPPVKPK